MNNNYLNFVDAMKNQSIGLFNFPIKLTLEEYELRQCANEVHELFCNATHFSQVGEITCDWYQHEEKVFDPWVMPEHARWLNIARVMKSKNVTLDDARDVFDEIYGITLGL